MKNLVIDLPYGWVCRSYQERVFEAFCAGIRRIGMIWHRRAGKDEVALHCTMMSAHERIGTYYHCAPTTEQGKRIIWNAINPHTGQRRVYDALPKVLIAKENATDRRYKE